MPNVPRKPNIPRGGKRAQRGAELKAEMEAKKAKAEAGAGAEVAGPQPGQTYTLEEGDTLNGIAQQVDQQPDAIWNHPENEQVRGSRGSPEELQAGDDLYIPAEAEDAVPVGQGEWVVKDGDCMASIAMDTGHFWEALWNDPANAELKQVRENPNILLPGDRVTIPPTRPKQESGATEERHRFVRMGAPEVLRVQLFGVEDKPFANAAYTIDVDGDLRLDRTTTSDGWVEESIPPDARKATITLTETGTVCRLALGHMDPIDSIRGVQARLTNIGYGCGKEDGVLGPSTRAALREFQSDHGLTLIDDGSQEIEKKSLEVLEQEHLS